MRLGLEAKFSVRAAYLKQMIDERLIEHRVYIREHGQDMPEIANWRWRATSSPGAKAGSTEADNV